MFSSYLNYYMWAFNVKNRDIAQEMFVDPSLVSKWRTGKRVPNEETTYKIAEVLVRFCTTEASRLKLCAFLNLHYTPQTFSEHPERIHRKLFELLTAGSDDAPHEAETSLSLGDEASGAEVDILREGDYQRYITRLFDAAIARGVPFQVLLYTSDEVGVLADDALFLEHWRQQLKRSEMMQATVKLIYHMTNNESKGVDYVRVWSNFKCIRNFSMYTLAVRSYNDTVVQPFLMVIPNVGACCAMRIACSKNRYITYFTDEAGVSALENDFKQLLSRCTPLTEMQSMNYRQLASFFYTSRAASLCRDAILHVTHLPVFTLPLMTLQMMLRQAGMSDSVITANLKAHRKLQSTLRNYLEQGAQLEIVLYLEHPEQMEGVELAHSPMYFDQTVVYSADTSAQHIAGTMDFLRRYRNVNFMLSDEPLYPADLLAGYNAFLMDFYLPYSGNVNLSFQQSYGYDVFAFLSAEIRSRALNRKGKDSTLRRLQKLLNGGA